MATIKVGEAGGLTVEAVAQRTVLAATATVAGFVEDVAASSHRRLAVLSTTASTSARSCRRT